MDMNNILLQKCVLHKSKPLVMKYLKITTTIKQYLGDTVYTFLNSKVKYMPIWAPYQQCLHYNICYSFLT